MGQARRRGTFEQRKAEAQKRNAAKMQAFAEEQKKRDEERRERFRRMPMRERMRLAQLEVMMAAFGGYLEGI